MNKQPSQAQGKQPFFGGQQAQQGNAQFEEKDMTQDLLASAKALADSYSILTQETACPQLRQLMMENWNQTITDQYTIFDAMRQRNWYQVKDAPPQEIQTAKQQFTQMKNQLN